MACAVWSEVWQVLPLISVDEDTADDTLARFRSAITPRAKTTGDLPSFQLAWSAYTLITLDAVSSKLAARLEDEAWTWQHTLACLIVLDTLCAEDAPTKNASPLFPLLVQGSLAALQQSSVQQAEQQQAHPSSRTDAITLEHSAAQKLEHATMLAFVETSVLQDLLGEPELGQVQAALASGSITEDIQAIVDDAVQAWTSGLQSQQSPAQSPTTYVHPLLEFPSLFADPQAKQDTTERVVASANTTPSIPVQALLEPMALPSMDVPFSRPLPPPAFPLYGHDESDYDEATEDETAALLEYLHAELIWLTPSCHRLLLLPEDEQDKAASEQFHKVLSLLQEQAFERPMAPNERREIVELVSQQDWGADEEDLGLTLLRTVLVPHTLPQLVEHNPLVAYECLVRILQSYPEDERKLYLSSLVGMDTSLHSMEVVNRLATTTTSTDDAEERPILETAYIHLFIGSCIESCSNVQDRHRQNRLVRLCCVFVQSLLRKSILHVDDVLFEVQPFCVEFSRIREANALYRTLQQQS